MTLVTIHAVVNVPADIGVTEVGCVIVAVATSALEHRIVTRVRMAGCANPIRVPVIGREIRVIERRSRPCRRGVASVASRREAGRFMVRIRRVVVIRLVAAHARCRQRRVIVVDMAHHAGHSGGCVEARQREGRVVVIERGSRPVRGAVTGIASRWEPGGRMRRRVRTVVIGLVARHARSICCGETVISVHVALCALQCCMRPGQGETSGRVIKRAVAPVCRGVALVAGLRESRGDMVRIGSPLEIFQVALRARAARKAVVIVHVALRAGQGSVRSCQCKSRGRVIERCRRPVRRAMARLAGLRESSRRVRRIARALEVG